MRQNAVQGGFRCFPFIRWGGLEGKLQSEQQLWSLKKKEKEEISDIHIKII